MPRAGVSNCGKADRYLVDRLNSDDQLKSCIDSDLRPNIIFPLLRINSAGVRCPRKSSGLAVNPFYVSPREL